MVRGTLSFSFRHVVVSIGIACAACAGCSKSDRVQASGRDDPAKTTQTEAVRTEKINRAVEVVGTLAAEDEVTVSSEAEGRVSRLLADLGDRVSANQVLVELDREKLGYNLEQQKAALERALAKYGASDIAHMPPIEETPDVQKAQAELVQARLAYDRAQELSKRELLPKQGLDDAEATWRAKQAARDSALQNAKNLRADIDATDASAKLADRQLRDTSIRAPFEGYVFQRLVSLGQFVKTQTPVMNLVRIDPLKVIAEIPEKMAPWIKVGEPVELHVDAYPQMVFNGKVSRISPAVNTATRAFQFEALVPNGDALLKPGTFARVHIQSGKVDDVMTLTYGALQYRYGVNRAFVVDGDHLVARELKTGDRMGDRIEIVSGLKPGESVAVTDVDRLTDGAHVSVRR